MHAIVFCLAAYCMQRVLHFDNYEVAGHAS